MPEICWTVHLGENWRICGKAISFDMSNCYRNWELYKIQHRMLDNPLKHTLEYENNFINIQVFRMHEFICIYTLFTCKY